MSKFAFIDETVRDPGQRGPGYYQLTAALVDGDVHALRQDTQNVAPVNGFHASELAAQGQGSAVEEMLEYIADRENCWHLIAVSTSIYTGRGQQEVARRTCLETLLQEIDGNKISHVIVDSRESVVGNDPQVRNRNDLQTLRGLRSRSLGVSRNMTLTHVHDSAEPLLWLPDAAGWAYRQFRLRQNSTYWDIVQDVTTVLDLG